MDKYDATEQAFKNGYSSGYIAGRRTVIGGDVTSVVRCEKCKHWHHSGYCKKLGMKHDRFGSDFCSYGERKDNGK